LQKATKYVSPVSVSGDFQLFTIVGHDAKAKCRKAQVENLGHFGLIGFLSLRSDGARIAAFVL
jgi:hypothetical protein